MTENANPKPFNIKSSEMSSSREQLYWVYHSVNQSIDPFTINLV